MRTIAGSNTGLATPFDVAVDAPGNVYVANWNNSFPSITVYAAGSNGNVAPVQTISGSNTGLGAPSGIALNPVNGDIYVANDLPAGSPSIEAFTPGANGNVSPIAAIKGGYTLLGGTHGLALDASGNIYAAESGGRINVYAAGANGDVPPIRVIKNPMTRENLNFPWGLTLDSSANIYIANYTNYPNESSVVVYAAGADRRARPIRRIVGARTNLNLSEGIALDSSGNIYVTNAGGPSYEGDVTVYAPSTRKNIKPINTITGPDTGLNGPVGITSR